MTLVEGSLEIRWENEPQLPARPRYSLQFRPHNYRRPVQEKIHIVGSESLGSYLEQIGFEPGEVLLVVGLIRLKRSIYIPNTMLSDRLVA